ncbi:hypothetical protein P153DRAFT_370317 [Dothidotthia symphoricarpi CBS 119687]|uniref:Ubiquitin 3 binding protein But2 C-terminal domain-containing protein n=1 Tax=Dothidotthia symphoricarpi CBS 119687 TaxID=1392245 RepID=A0A6A6A1E1_9PLEO|nr:uncharacterized protein P153DRAFT_370317 [Dothidotthia symphoricarpi CBS 119687]KAF2124993.1 hypothetical protein P153DRAFT_370317 [Dothidotthia symphoricarpi CBS 119687]
MRVITKTTTTYTAVFTLVPETPTAVEKRQPNVLKPSSIAIYHSFNGAITPPVSQGEVSRNSSNGRDTTTLVTFDLNGRTLPPTCSLRFHLDPKDSIASCTGTGHIDVFSSLKPAPIEGSAGWGGPGNQRNVPLGRMQVHGDGDATVLDFAPNQLGAFSCLEVGGLGVEGGVLAFELVPVGEQYRVTWDAGRSGLFLSW